MKLATAKQMKSIDNRSMTQFGISGLFLMENAAKGIFNEVKNHTKSTEDKICVVCGSGNNGGDGACAAWMLKKNGFNITVILVGRREKFTPDMREMISRCETEKVPIIYYNENESDVISSSDIVIDAIFGVGLNRDVQGPALSAIKDINAGDSFVIAADISSGIEADSGRVLGDAVKCDVTVTFSLAKPGHFIEPGSVYTGELKIWDIGIPKEVLDEEELHYIAFDNEELDKLIPVRKKISHKGTYGKVMMICGSEGYSGAASMAAQAAMRTGSGLVTLCVPRSIYAIVAGKNAEVMVHPLEDKEGKIAACSLATVEERLKTADVLVLGPGLGRGAEVEATIREIIRKAAVPIIVDADGLNALAADMDILKDLTVPVIVTPHEGEYLHMGGIIGDNRLESAINFSEKYGCITVLKGHRTITALPDGTAFINTTGNPGMAKGGSGDVLTGIIASLVGQNLPLEKAVAAAQYIHGKAGDICAETIGQYSMLPTDLIDHISVVLKKYQ